MDLEKINEEYGKLKAELEVKRKKVEEADKKALKLRGEYLIQDGNLKVADADGNEDAAKKAREEKDKIEKELEKLEEELITMKKELEKVSEKIEEKISQIQNDPEMKKHLETIMQKKYSRKINSLNKEKEELSEKKGKLEFFQKLIEEHPALENAIKGMVQAKETLKRLKDEEARGIEPRFFGEDEECEEKLETNKKTLMDYFAKHSINITEKDLEDITSLEFTKGKDGRIDVKSSVKREISKTEKQIRSVDKNIANHKSALEKVNGRSKTEKPDKSKAKTEETERTETESSEKVSARSETERADESRAEIEETEKPESSEKPKWYQFVKRFKNWRERRKQSTLPSRDEEPTKEEPVEKTAKKDDGKKFRDSLKYDIVKDIVDKTERDELKQAKMERKKSEGRDR